jgi:hypothetical protein
MESRRSEISYKVEEGAGIKGRVVVWRMKVRWERQTKGRRGKAENNRADLLVPEEERQQLSLNLDEASGKGRRWNLWKPGQKNTSNVQTADIHTDSLHPISAMMIIRIWYVSLPDI